MEDKLFGIGMFCLVIVANIIIVILVIKYYEDEPKIK